MRRSGGAGKVSPSPTNGRGPFRLPSTAAFEDECGVRVPASCQPTTPIVAASLRSLGRPPPRTRVDPPPAAQAPGRSSRCVGDMRGLIERSTPVRSVIKMEPVQRALHAVRGCRAVERGRPGFVYRQLRGAGVASYRLHNGITVYVRHGSADMTIFTRIFWRGTYEPPQAIRERLGGALRVVDLGANIGLFSASLGRRATVTAVEADPENAVLLRRMVATSQLPWRVIQAYAANEGGTTRFAVGRRCLSKAAPDGDEVEKLDVFPLFDGADLLKMDIEGAEWDILAD